MIVRVSEEGFFWPLLEPATDYGLIEYIQVTVSMPQNAAEDDVIGIIHQPNTDFYATLYWSYSFQTHNIGCHINHVESLSAQRHMITTAQDRALT
jgi:hypothetical protein